MIDKICKTCKKPISIFGILACILTLVLVYCTHMQVPDFYANKELADKIAQEVPHNMIYTTTQHLITPHYNVINALFHTWAWLITFLVFCLIFKIKAFSDFKELKLLNKKLFAYLWVNLSYPIFAHCYIFYYMLDLNEYVYNHASDSMGIPFFVMYIFFIMLALIYYPLANFLVFITYNTNVPRIFYNFIWVMTLPIIVLTVCSCFDKHFSFLCCILNLCMLISFVFIIYAIGYKK